MAHWFTVGVAALLFLCYQWYQWDQIEEFNSKRPMLPSMVVFVAVLGQCVDKVNMPQVMPSMHCRLNKFLFELFVSIFVIYFGMVVIWHSLELFIVLYLPLMLCSYRLVSESNYKFYEEFWIGGVTLPLSLIIFSMMSKHLNYMIHLNCDKDTAMKYLKRRRGPRKAPGIQLRASSRIRNRSKNQ